MQDRKWIITDQVAADEAEGSCYADDLALAKAFSQAIGAGDDLLIADFYNRFDPVLRRQALYMTGGDIDAADEAVAVLWSDLVAKDIMVRFKGSCKLTTYLIRVLRNKIADLGRRSRRELLFADLSMDRPGEEANDYLIDHLAQERAEMGEFYDAFADLLDGEHARHVDHDVLHRRLQEMQAAIVVLSEQYPDDAVIIGLRLKQVSFRDMAAQLGRSEVALRKANSRALERLRRILGSQCHDLSSSATVIQVQKVS